VEADKEIYDRFNEYRKRTRAYCRIRSYPVRHMEVGRDIGLIYEVNMFKEET